MMLKNHNKFIWQRARGVTLIELALYTGLAASLLVAASFLLMLALSARIKSDSISMVEEEGALVMRLVTQSVRNANLITAPSIGATLASLTLDVADPAKDPTIFDFDAPTGAIRIKEGAGAAVRLTSSRIIASGLTFQNLSRPSTPGVVRIQFTLARANPSGRNEYQYQKTFYGSAAVRP
ncbi:MAG: hypothetical protein AAB539_02940 [Patescibacteria group bacterium]